MPTIVSTLSAAMLERSGQLACFVGETLLAMDIEGVDLGRHGIVSLIQLATREHCFVFDVQEKAIDDPLVIWLKMLLQDSNITKIVHDCRMDSDALQHCLGITMQNVHDTSSWHGVLFGEINAGLNNMLNKYNITQNEARDGSIYNKGKKDRHKGRESRNKETNTGKGRDKEKEGRNAEGEAATG